MELDRPFVTLATQNPIEQEGTYPLPEAQLDRFLFKVMIDYPAEDEESTLVEAVTTGRSANSLSVDAVQPVADAARVVSAQAATAEIRVTAPVVQYAVRIARATRSSAGISIGAGPRGAIAMVRSARAAAVLGWARLRGRRTT